MTEFSNRLQESSSPYLLKHRNNPVHWQLWENSVLEKAKKQNKPILLSIGYAACHWCHVMAEESFADEQTAELMNENFVCIKLDKEERPDLDKIYQLSHQLLLQRPGGWPLTVFLTPDKQIPFFIGTYFPPQARNGLPAFSQILERVSAYFQNEGKSITEQSEQIQGFFKTIDQRQISQQVNSAPITTAIQSLKEQYDHQYGGFGRAPKFPFSSSLDFMLKQWHKTAYAEEPNRDQLFMVSHSLQAMARSGLYDQIGGGFYPYSIDQAWMIPHFEKMLYDNIQLLPLYAQMFQVSGDLFYKKIATDISRWLQRELLDKDDFFFFSTLDADSETSEGDLAEGEFYVWDKAELEQALNLDEIHLAEHAFNLQNEANYSDRYHLSQVRTVAALAEQLQLPQAKIEEQLQLIKSKLLVKREQRPHPFRDYKKLTSWNALAVNGLAVAARSLQDAGLSVLATKVLDGIHKSYLEHGLLVQLSQHSHAKPAFLDAYAYLLHALIEQLQNSWNSDHLHWANELASHLLDNFSNAQGGFYFVSNDETDELLYRPLTYSDAALPAGNAIATLALLKLGHLLGESRYLSFADKTIKHCFDEVSRSPHAHASMLQSLDEYLEPSKQIIIRGAKEDIASWKNTLQTLYSPKLQVYAIDQAESSLPEALNTKFIKEITVAYVCEGLQCSEPIYELEKLIEIIQNYGK